MDRSRRAALQEAMADWGIVLPRLARGTPAQPAQGWYAEMQRGSRAGEIVFLGDYAGLAEARIARLRRDSAARVALAARPADRTERS